MIVTVLKSLSKFYRLKELMRMADVISDKMLEGFLRDDGNDGYKIDGDGESSELNNFEADVVTSKNKTNIGDKTTKVVQSEYNVDCCTGMGTGLVTGTGTGKDSSKKEGKLNEGMVDVCDIDKDIKDKTKGDDSNEVSHY